MTVKLKKNKEHLFKLDDIEVIFYVLKVKGKGLK